MAEDVSTPSTPGARALAADALALLALGYLGVRLRLQAGDGVLPAWIGVAALLLAGGGVACLAALAWRRDGGGRARVALAVAEVVAIGGVLVALGALGGLPPSPQGNFWWLALEWTKLPDNLLLVARLSPAASGLAVLATVAGVALLARPGGAARVAAGLGAAALALGIGAGLSGIGADQRVLVYWVLFSGPWAAVAVGALAGARRLAARALVGAVAGTLLVVHYLGWLPLGAADPAELEGVRRVYPPPGAAPEVPLAFLRDLVVDADAGRLYSAYGPASGILAVDLASGALERHETPDGLVRQLWREPGAARLLALDWVQGDLLTIDERPFGISRRRALIAPGRSVPMGFLVGAERLVVVWSELPRLLEVARDGLVPGRELDFRALGLTAYRSGAWSIVGDVDDGFALVEIGAVDAAGRYLLLRVDLDRFEVVGARQLPEGGLGLLWVPERDAAYAASFFGTRIDEIRASDLEPTGRVLAAPLNTRTLVHDARRDLLFALGFLSGELAVIDLADASTRCTLRVGNKSMSLAIDPRGDRLYLGGSTGLFEVELATLLADGGACPRAGAPS